MTSLLVDGTVYGLQLSLLAVGLTLIFGLGGVLNLAHGDFAIVAGISTWLLIRKGVVLPVAAGLGILTAGVVGLIIDRLLLLPAYRLKGEGRLLLGLMLTLGLALAIEGCLTYIYPQASLSWRLPTPRINVLGVIIRTASLAVAVGSIVVLLSLVLFLKTTSLGKAIRCIIQNETGAELCGIDRARIRTLIFVLGASIGGLVGIAQGLFTSLGPERGFELTVFALIVTTVGGVRSINGTLMAGILLGVVHAFASYFVGAYMTYVILLATAAFTVLIRPSGLLGHWT
jgi:branched-chain amino acid transport system permease protein